ncbi:MAG: M56 family metallopeptidase [Planctomycetota bacterium]
MSIFGCAVSNVVVAVLLGGVAIIVERVTTKPQLTHALWVLVLVKLVTPPLIQVPVNYTVAEYAASQKSSGLTSTAAAEQFAKTYGTSPQRPSPNEKAPVDSVAGQELESSPARDGAANADAPAGLQPALAVPWGKVLLAGWATGSLFWFLLAVTRLVRFRRVLRLAHREPGNVESQVRHIASRYGLHDVPRVLVADAKVPPLVWSLGGRAAIVLPSGLLSRLSTAERAGLLAHELAHLRRRDHWVRWFEFVVLGLYWWNPVAWWAKAHIQQAEEECCDAWVLWAYPASVRQYAQTLVDTVEYLADSREFRLNTVPTFSQGDSLRRRIEMIVSSKVDRRLSWRLRSVVVLTVLAVAPISLSGNQTDVDERGEKDGSQRTKTLQAIGLTPPDPGSGDNAERLLNPEKGAHSSSVGTAKAAEDQPDAETPLERIAEASRASWDTIDSAVGVGTYESHHQGENGEQLTLRTKAKVRVYCDAEKYRLEFEYDRWEGRPSDREAVVIGNGTRAYLVRYSQNISPHGCAGHILSEVDEALEYARCYVDDPAHLQRRMLRVHELLKSEEPIEVIRHRWGYRGKFRPKSGRGLTIEFDAHTQLGYRIAASRQYNKGADEPCSVRRAVWKEGRAFWYVKSVVEEYDSRRVNRTGEYRRHVLRYDNFQPNAKVDPELFVLESLDIPFGTRFIDHRQNPEHRFLYFNEGTLSPSSF